MAGTEDSNYTIWFGHFYAVTDSNLRADKKLVFSECSPCSSPRFPAETIWEIWKSQFNQNYHTNLFTERLKHYRITHRMNSELKIKEHYQSTKAGSDRLKLSEDLNIIAGHHLLDPTTSSTFHCFFFVDATFFSVLSLVKFEKRKDDRSIRPNLCSLLCRRIILSHQDTTFKAFLTLVAAKNSYHGTFLEMKGKECFKKNSSRFY